MRTSTKATILASLTILAGCHRYSFSAPPAPLVIEVSTRAPDPTACAASDRPDAVARGGTPPPVAEGELALTDVRGDDRLAVSGHFLTAWSADGERLVTVQRDGAIVWKTRTAEVDRAFPFSVKGLSLREAALSPSGAWLAASGVARDDHPVMLLVHLEGAPSVQRFDVSRVALRFSADGRRLVSPGHTWDLTTGAHTRAPMIEEQAHLLPDGERAIVLVPTKRESGRVVPELRAIDTGRVLRRFPEASSYQVAISGDGERLAILDRGLDVLSIASGARVAHLDDAGGAVGVSLSYDGRRAILWEPMRGITFLGSEPREPVKYAPPALTVWDLDRGARVFRDDTHGGAAWDFTRDGRFLMGPVTRLVEEILRADDGRSLRFGQRIMSVSPDSRWALASEGGRMFLASPDGSMRPPRLRPAARVLARSDDGRFEAATGADGSLELKASGKCTRLGTLMDPSGNVVFSRDGAHLFATTRGGGYDAAFFAWHTDSGAPARVIRSRQSASIIMNPRAGQVLFQGVDGRVLRFDALTGAALPAADPPRMTYSPPRAGEVWDVRDSNGERPSLFGGGIAAADGRHVIVPAFLGRWSVVSVWDLVAPERVVDLAVPGLLEKIARSPDDRFVTAGLRDGRVVLWRRERWRAVKTEAAHAERVLSFAFSPSGDRLASAGDDGLVLLIDTATGRVTGRARLPFDRARGLWFSQDGRELVADTDRGLAVRLRVGP